MTDIALPSLLATANHLRRGLADFARRMRAMRDDHGVSASKLSALGRLLRAGHPLSAKELARLERLQPQSLTRIIADLEADGLIVRRQNESDRRQYDIAISEAGAELLRRDARRQNEWLAKAMAEKLTPAERAILALAAELLDRLADHDAPDGRRTGHVRRRGDDTMNDEHRFQSRSIDDGVFRDCSMARSQFDDVNLSATVFTNVDLRNAKFVNVNLAGAGIDDANIEGLTILGHDIQALIRAELMRRNAGKDAGEPRR